MKKSGRTFFALLVASLVGAGSALLPLPASASPEAVCVDDLCTVTIGFSGEQVTWSPPANARNLSFELFGAQGGKTGGLGGKVSGNLTSIPESLIIVVGGAGLSGSAVAGGFNGGGRAGTSSALEGSGGGATDIRLGAELETRIAVAGGGGGRGAGLGGTGGMGGGLTAGNGKTGQGGGGGGGTQVAGGAGGVRFGTGTNGTSGTLGIGGTGGEGTVFGGGGGGGGYYGGGGGGSDTDGCCYDAGGGGGGSSYTDPVLITSVVHTQAVRSGSGLAILRYQLVPTLESITTVSTITNNATPTFAVVFSQPITGFDDSDVVITHSGEGCESVTISGSSESYEVILSDCTDGDVFIAVLPLSVSNLQLPGPEFEVVSQTVLLDYTTPEIDTWSVTEDGSQIEFVLTEPVPNLTLEEFIFTPTQPECIASEPETLDSVSYVISLTGCESSDYTLTLIDEKLQDAAGNLGPSASFVVSFEYPRPQRREPNTEITKPVEEVISSELVAKPSKKKKIEPEVDSTSKVDATSTIEAELPQVSEELDPVAKEIVAAPPLRQSAQELIKTVETPRAPMNPAVFWLATLGSLALLSGIFLTRRRLAR